MLKDLECMHQELPGAFKVFTGQNQTTVVVEMQSPEHHTRDTDLGRGLGNLHSKQTFQVFLRQLSQGFT